MNIDATAVISTLDWDTIHSRMDNLCRNPGDFYDAKRLVVLAVDKFLPRDLVEFDLISLEETTFHQPPPLTLPIRQTTDIRARFKGRFPTYAPYKGHEILLDWKTTGGELNTEWRRRYLHSWQWRIYSHFSPRVRAFAFRGLSRSTYDVTELMIEVPKTNGEEVTHYLTSSELLLRSQQERDIWVRHMPWACKAYGRVCPFVESCLQYTMPRGTVDNIPYMGYTLYESFHLCPERFRRNQIVAEIGVERGLLDSEVSDETLIGTAVHEGLKEVYSQAFNLIKLYPELLIVNENGTKQTKHVSEQADTDEYGS